MLGLGAGAETPCEAHAHAHVHTDTSPDTDTSSVSAFAKAVPSDGQLSPNGQERQSSLAACPQQICCNRQTTDRQTDDRQTTDRRHTWPQAPRRGVYKKYLRAGQGDTGEREEIPQIRPRYCSLVRARAAEARDTTCPHHMPTRHHPMPQPRCPHASNTCHMPRITRVACTGSVA